MNPSNIPLSKPMTNLPQNLPVELEYFEYSTSEEDKKIYDFVIDCFQNGLSSLGKFFLENVQNIEFKNCFLQHPERISFVLKLNDLTELDRSFLLVMPRVCKVFEEYKNYLDNGEKNPVQQLPEHQEISNKIFKNSLNDKLQKYLSEVFKRHIGSRICRRLFVEESKFKLIQAIFKENQVELDSIISQMFSINKLKKIKSLLNKDMDLGDRIDRIISLCELNIELCLDHTPLLNDHLDKILQNYKSEHLINKLIKLFEFLSKRSKENGLEKIYSIVKQYAEKRIITDEFLYALINVCRIKNYSGHAESCFNEFVDFIMKKLLFNNIKLIKFKFFDFLTLAASSNNVSVFKLIVQKYDEEGSTLKEMFAHILLNDKVDPEKKLIFIKKMSNLIDIAVSSNDKNMFIEIFKLIGGHEKPITPILPERGSLYNKEGIIRCFPLSKISSLENQEFIKKYLEKQARAQMTKFLKEEKYEEHWKMAVVYDPSYVFRSLVLSYKSSLDPETYINPLYPLSLSPDQIYFALSHHFIQTALRFSKTNFGLEGLLKMISKNVKDINQLEFLLTQARESEHFELAGTLVSHIENLIKNGSNYL